MMISIAGGLVFIGVVAFVYLEVQEKARFAAIASFLVCAVLGAGEAGRGGTGKSNARQTD